MEDHHVVEYLHNVVLEKPIHESYYLNFDLIGDGLSVTQGYCA